MTRNEKGTALFALGALALAAGHVAMRAGGILLGLTTADVVLAGLAVSAGLVLLREA